jgi:predicted O-methyltransferase YrrM
MRILLVRALSPLINLFKLFLYYGLPERIVKPNTIDVLEKRAMESSAQYIEEHGASAMIFRSRSDFWSFAIDQVSIKGLYTEFGVSYGKSIKYFANKISKNEKIYGFDSFQGLRENFFGTAFTKGEFSTGGVIPKLPNNVSLINGWFADTLPTFLKEYASLFSFIHMDADTYESTKQVLELIGSRITTGTIIVFDEYLGNPNWINCEYKAWQEFVSLHKITYQYLAFSPQAAALIVK